MAAKDFRRRFNSNAAPYTADQIQQERELYRASGGIRLGR